LVDQDTKHTTDRVTNNAPSGHATDTLRRNTSVNVK